MHLTLTDLSLLGLVLILIAQTSAQSATTFSPVSFNDSTGNIVDGSSTITWGPLPRTVEYQITTDNVDYDVGAMNTLYDMMNKFLDVVFLQDAPFASIKDALDGNLDIAGLGMYIGGYGACIVVGFLFVLLMPLIGCCWCCCYCCCDNCGGTKVWKDKYDKNTNCCFFGQAIAVLLITIFLFCGCALLYATNEETGKTVSNLGDLVNDNLDDGKAFINNTVAEFEHIGKTNFIFTKEVILRDLNNVGYLIGVPVQRKLETEGKINEALDNAYAIKDLIDTQAALLTSIDTKSTELQDSIDAFSTEMSALTTKLDTYNTNSPCSDQSDCKIATDSTGLNANIDTSNFPDTSAAKSDMDAVTGTDITSNIDQGKADFTNIPQKVQDDTEDLRNDIKDDLDSFVTSIEDGLADITKMSEEVNPQLDDIKGEVDTIFTENSYDKYRWYAMIGLTCMILLMVLLNILGLVFGLLGRNNEPFDRSGGSKCASRFFIGSVVLIFIFSWLLMFICTLTFAIGAPIGAVFCHELTNPDYTVYKEILDGPDSLIGSEGEYPLAKMLLGSKNAQVELTFSGILEGCKKDEPAWTTLKLSYLLNLTDITDYKKNVDIQSQVNAFSVDLSSIEFFDATTEDQLKQFKDAVNIDFQGFIDELSQDTLGTSVPLSTKVENLRAVTLSSSTQQADVRAAGDELEGIRVGSYQTMVDKQAELLQVVKEMQNSSQQVPGAVDAVISSMQQAENYIQQNASAVVTDEISSFADRAVRVADSYVNKVNTAVQTEAAKCRPFYNFYHSMVINLMCDQVIGNFNAFWFSLGWCLFFMVPSLILSVKITKYLRQFRRREGEQEQIPAKNQISPEPQKYPIV